MKHWYLLRLAVLKLSHFYLHKFDYLKDKILRYQDFDMNQNYLMLNNHLGLKWLYLLNQQILNFNLVKSNT